MFGENCCWHVLHEGRYVRQRLVRRRPLLRIERVRYQLRGMRCLEWQMQHMQAGQLCQRRLQVLCE